MKNYGEDVAYWYLRLNGFFPLANFVMHPTEPGERQGDIDLLAVRPPHVFETVGGQETDWDRSLFDRLPRQRWIGVICEVKSGAMQDGEPLSPDRLSSGVRRLGLLDPLIADEATRVLHDGPIFDNGTVAIAKLLITARRVRKPGYLDLLLSSAEEFIELRAARYPVEKHRDRIYFPSGIFQYAIARASRGEA